MEIGFPLIAGFLGLLWMICWGAQQFWESLGVELLLLRITRSQLGWFGHLTRMPHGQIPRELHQAHFSRWRYLSSFWLGNVWVFPRRGWNLWSGIEKSGQTFSACCHRDLDPERQSRLYVFMFVWIVILWLLLARKKPKPKTELWIKLRMRMQLVWDDVSRKEIISEWCVCSCEGLLVPWNSNSLIKGGWG